MGLLDELKKLNPEWFPVKPKSVTDGFRYGFPEPEEFQPSDAISAPTIAGGLLSLDPTDYVGPNTLAKGAAAIKGLLGATAAKATAIPVMAGIFAGKSAKTADLVKQGLAEKMLKAGEDPAKVWKETGWGIGPDGKWRFEIPDNTARLNLKYNGKSGEISSSGNLENGLSHDELFAANPDMKSIQASIYEGRSVPEQGSYSNNGPQYNEFFPQLIAQGQNAKSPLLHELQHAIQQREGFAMGVHSFHCLL